MDLNSIKILLYVFVLIFSVISWISYMVRRSDNKSALRRLEQDGKALRTMTAEERALVQPFLFLSSNPKKSAQLINDGVFALTGAFVRHGLESGNGGGAMHDTLGGVDVVLPYDAREYLREDNQAEVVMTEKFAIVVALNGEFDLAGGRDRDQRRKKQDVQWHSGKAGSLPNVVTPPAEPSDPALTLRDEHDDQEQDEAPHVEILGQRDETPAEIADRRRPGIGLGVSVLWLLVFVFLGLTAQAGGAWAGVSALLLVAAVWRTWRRPAPDAPQKVNRARGELTGIELVNPANSSVVSTHLFLGDKLPLTLPSHWGGRKNLHDDGEIDVDMRVQDYSVVRLGRNCSIDEEQRMFPRVFWGRHVTLALVGVLAVFFLFVLAGHLIKGDVAMTSAWVSGSPPRTYDSSAALAQELPQFGTMVSLQGRARCELQPSDYSNQIWFDCSRLRWGGNTPSTVALDVDDATMSLYTGRFIRTKANPLADLIIKNTLYLQSGNNPLAMYGADMASAVSVLGVTNMVLNIERTCALTTGQDNSQESIQAYADCDGLKTTLAKNLMLAKDEADGWLELLKLAQNGVLTAKGAKDEGIMVSRYVSSARRYAESAMQPRIQHAVNQASQSAMKSQQGGVLVQVLPGPYASLPSLKTGLNLMDAWGQRQKMLAADGVMPFQVSGLVVGAGEDGSGAPEIVVDATRSLDNPWPSLARMVWLLLAVLLVLVHTTLALIRTTAASARERKLLEYGQRQGGVKSAFF
ncbi:IgaA/UmoB family intracellular growth attenuator [Achromobacter seleniivolatilans]|uniref:IgaA/UmoB family intracellular growth attenuator n=1 Tax=Achromobacter seleniivolatilans TaxID=3047478 RepID=A0ABY9M543_9BURK|nr:IgaA/UmoB family intracellular growth attenuator [Achromobacter sp. R39]WMD21298.1 IgaA/UmoB family intracellular growth attenuator [Achromobacter sp. R39]